MKIWTKIVILAVVMFALYGCGGSSKGNGGGPSGSTELAGEWVLNSWAGSQEMAEKVYVAFDKSGGFTLYQNVDKEGFTKLTGKYSYDEESKALTGTYSDNKAWKDSYTVTGLSSKSLTIKSTEGAVSIYSRTTIPDWVIGTRSEKVEIPAEERFL